MESKEIKEMFNTTEKSIYGCTTTLKNVAKELCKDKREEEKLKGDILEIEKAYCKVTYEIVQKLRKTKNEKVEHKKENVDSVIKHIIGIGEKMGNKFTEKDKKDIEHDIYSLISD